MSLIKMEAVIFCGIQATGKSTFFKERFFNTHMRISLDQLNTRNKELRFIETCILTFQPFVIDNTNPMLPQAIFSPGCPAAASLLACAPIC
jgi:hypothetical protein